MKLICDIITNNLQYSIQGVAPKNRAKRSQINVGKNSNNEIFMVVQSADNKTGTQYMVSGNICKTFDRFAHEGKCTIRLKQPTLDIIVSKCDPMQLRIFLKIVKSGHMPGDEDTKLLANLPSKHKKLKSAELAKKTELTITTRRELLTATFSHLLVKLELVGVGLSEIPPSIAKLSRLQILNLSGNKLRSLLPTFVGPLRELNLAGNQLADAHYRTWKFFELDQIKKNLQNLNLSNNQIRFLPLQLCDIPQLFKLEVKGNQIKHFPPYFGNLKRLRILDMSDNRTDFINASFQQLNLDTLDISGNHHPYDTIIIFDAFPRNIVPTLLQSAAVKVVNLKLPQHELPETLREYLQVMRRCRCLAPVWHNRRSVLPFELNKITRQLISDAADKTFPMEVYFCANLANCMRHERIL